MTRAGLRTPPPARRPAVVSLTVVLAALSLIAQVRMTWAVRRGEVGTASGQLEVAAPR